MRSVATDREHESIDVRAELGQLLAAGRIGDARRVLASLHSLSSGEKLAQCLVEAASGNESDAFTAAVDLVSRDVDPAILVEALALAGRVDYAKGRSVDGANRFARAKQVAGGTGNKTLTRAVATHTKPYFTSTLWRARSTTFVHCVRQRLPPAILNASSSSTSSLRRWRANSVTRTALFGSWSLLTCS